MASFEGNEGGEEVEKMKGVEEDDSPNSPLL